MVRSIDTFMRFVLRWQFRVRSRHLVQPHPLPGIRCWRWHDICPGAPISFGWPSITCLNALMPSQQEFQTLLLYHLLLVENAEVHWLAGLGNCDTGYILYSLTYSPVKQQIDFKLALLTFEVFNGVGPGYMQSFPLEPPADGHNFSTIQRSHCYA